MNAQDPGILNSIIAGHLELDDGLEACLSGQLLVPVYHPQMDNEEYDDFAYEQPADASLGERLLEGLERVAGRISGVVLSAVMFPLRLVGIGRRDDEAYIEVGGHDFVRRGSREKFPFRLPGMGKREGIIEIGEHDEAHDEAHDARSGLGSRLRFGLGWLFFFAIQVPFGDCADFTSRWLWSRDYRKLLYAIPSVLLMAIALGSVALSILSSPRRLAAHYRKAAAIAMDSRDFDAANLCQQRLEQLEPSNTHDAFVAAERLAESGELEQALEQMQQLALIDGIGYLPAHLWIAHALATNRVTLPDGDPQQRIKLHLDQVLSRDPKNELALQLLAEHHAAQGATEDAVAALKQVRPGGREAQVERDMQMAYLKARGGHIAQANEILSKSTNELARMFERGKSLSANSFANWANGQVQLGDREDGIRILQLGIEQYPDNEMLRETYRAACAKLQQTYLASDQLANKHLELLRRLLAFEPNEEQVMLMIANASASSSISDEALSLLQPKLRKGTLSAGVYESLANAAMIRGNQSEARRLYTLLLKKDSQRPIALNNLAYMLAHNEPTSFARALTLIEQAISIDESNVALRGTRGLILLKLERWNEASKDLESAINGNPQYDQLYHEALAMVYAKMGHQELSSYHRNRSIALLSSN